MNTALFVNATISRKVKALWAPSGTNHNAKLAISLRVVRSLYKHGVFTSLPDKSRTITVPGLSGL